MLADNLTTKCAIMVFLHKFMVLLDLIRSYVGLGAAHDGLRGASRMFGRHLR